MILIILAILQILIVRSILKIRKKDYSVLRALWECAESSYAVLHIRKWGGSWYRGSYRDVDRDADHSSGRQSHLSGICCSITASSASWDSPAYNITINAFDGIFL